MLSAIDSFIKTKQFQKHLLQVAFQQGRAVAMWQLPNQLTQHLIIDLQQTIQQKKLDVEESEAGFVISPFLNENLDKSYFIKADLYYQFGENKSQEQHHSTLPYHEKVKFDKALKESLILKDEIDFKHYLKAIQTHSIPHYQTLVKKAIQAIEAKEFQKVVLSRVESKAYPRDFQLIEAFQKLCKQYANAFCYFFHLPHIGTWMGASPETLIHTDKNQRFQTVALAGTQAHHPNHSAGEAVWTQKEIEEQAMVSRYIINCFKKIRLREFEEEGPKTVIAGNLLHLKTIFSVDMQAVNFPQLGTVMLDLLHPTSAVCGMPKEPALSFIQQYEGYDRAFYSGFLGPVHIQEECHIFVNLRCIQFLKDEILFYAGAGITEDSTPEKEWQETVMKCNTMRSVLCLKE